MWLHSQTQGRSSSRLTGSFPQYPQSIRRDWFSRNLQWRRRPGLSRSSSRMKSVMTSGCNPTWNKVGQNGCNILGACSKSLMARQFIAILMTVITPCEKLWMLIDIHRIPCVSLPLWVPICRGRSWQGIIEISRASDRFLGARSFTTGISTGFIRAQ